MKKFIIVCSIIFCTFLSKAQLLSWSPSFAKDVDNIAITIDGTQGNQALNNFANNVYIHCGVITSSSSGPADWKYVKFAWGTTNTSAQATAAGTNKWVYTINNIRTFFGVPFTENILKIALLFRDGAGNIVQRNTDGSDMYIPIYNSNLAVQFTTPAMQPKFTLTPEPINATAGSTFPITAIASANSNMKLYLNGMQIQFTSNTTSISASPTLTSGSQVLLVESTTTTPAATVKDSISFFVANAPNIAALPAGVKEGINYQSNTQVTLVLYAPNKNRVAVIGEFANNNWTENSTYQMNKTPDGNYWWITINGLTSGQIYAYQYLVNGSLRIADPYTEMVLDQNNDNFVSAATFPNLKTYPTGLTSGIVGTLQTNQAAYNWQVPNFVKPNKKGLIIYEVLLRDFIDAHDFKTLKDSIPYFKNLGVNTINVMPFNEFDGNESWGYNGAFFTALDKYYGTKERLKQFVDAAHQNGIAVVMDIALNHCTGQAPQAALYWNSSTNQPAPDNPWLNVTATHPYSVFNDFNHESVATKYFVNRVIEYWLTEYKIDGFRWDLSKGFSQRNCGNDLTCWNNYDFSRVAIWKNIYDKMQAVAPNSYCILEHLGDNIEERDLADYGMLLWGKMTDEYNQVSMGFTSNSDFSRVFHTARNWTNPHLIGYAQSHDEERTMYKNLNNGNASGSYNTRQLPTALRREEMLAALFLTTPGPKMWWQFAELGYDYSINYCTNGTVNNNCRLDKKPIRWDYYQETNRKRLYDIYASINNLRKLKPNTFRDGTIQYGTTGVVKWIKVSHSSLDVLVIANMDVVQQTGNVTFQTAGTWYSYLLGATIATTASNQAITLAPGEYHIYINQNINGTVLTPITSVQNSFIKMDVLIYPNPVFENTKLRYELPESGKLDISLLNPNGQFVHTIYNGYKTKGNYTTNFITNTFNTKLVSSGYYFIKFTINGKTKVEKIFIVK